MAGPAFQFYARDFLDSTLAMPAESVGVYIRLLAWSWTNGPVPDDMKAMAQLGAVTPARMRAVWITLSAKWKRTPDGNGLINERLEQQRAIADAYSLKQAQNGAKGGAKRKPQPSQKEAVA